MIKLFKGIFKNEKGQVVILFPFLFIVLCGFIGLAVDTSWIVYNKHKLQNSTDLAALSGGQSLPSDTSNASADVLTYLHKNYEESIGANITFSNTNHRMDVDSQDTINLFFSPLFGVNTAEITATAAVQVGPVRKTGNVIPIGVDYRALPPAGSPANNQSILLYGSFDNGGVKISGNFGLVDPTNNNIGSVDIVDFIINDCPEAPYVNNPINTKTGYMPNRIEDAVNSRLAKGPEYATVICPVVDWASDLSGNSTSLIVLAYATFKVTSVTRHGNDLEIRATFDKVDFDPTGIPGDVPDYGVRCIALVK